MRKIHHHWTLLWAAKYVAHWEGLSLTAYWDSLGGVWTIAYGHTANVRQGETVTKAQAMNLLMSDLSWAAAAVNRAVKVPITVRQRIALISIVFNVGPGVLEGTHLIHDLNARDYKRAADRFLEWDHAGGVVVEGLRDRRLSERWMFLHTKR